MRILCTVFAMCLLSSAAPAQDGLRSASLPDRTPMQPIPAPRTDQFLAQPKTYAPRFDRSRGRQRHRQTVPFGYGGYVGDLFVPADSRGDFDMPPNGYLHLDMQPGSAEVHVDGFFMGTVDDFRRLIPGRALEAGPHRVELRAAGYQTATFDVRIDPHHTVTYRSDLQASPAESARAVAPAVPKTFYVIPGCYAGDRPPRLARLGPRCDASKVRTIPPVVGTYARAQR